MPRAPSGQHERVLKEYCDELRTQGYNVVETHGKIPDAIATKDGKLIAVEVLIKIKRSGKGKGWRPMGGYTLDGKRRNYYMYDDVLIRTDHKE